MRRLYFIRKLNDAYALLGLYLTVEVSLTHCAKRYLTLMESEKRVVTSNSYILTCFDLYPSLTNDYFTSLHALTISTLYPKVLRI